MRVFYTLFCMSGCAIASLTFQSCNPSENASSVSVAEENKHEGTTDWLLTKIKTDTCRISVPYQETFLCRSTEIEGYVSKTSYRVGDRVDVFVSTHPQSSFTVDIYRMGYYGGKGGRHIKSLGPFNGIAQPTPDDGELNLRECKWQKSFDFTISEGWVSGVYLGKLTATTTGFQSYVIFIVKDDRKADFIFQCSDLTWQSYNRWPEWRSGYDWYYKSGGHNPWHTDVGAEVSFDRPYTFYMNHLPVGLLPHINGSGEFLLWEFPLAFWMEEQGYDVTYVSNLDVHENKDELLRAKGFLSVGHDEYWTRQMYNHVSQARDGGVSLLFLGGNSLSGEVYLKPSGGSQPNRIFGRVDRFHDEERLMGSKSYGVGLGDWTCQMPEHWVFEGSGLKKGDTIKDLIGWEYHGFPLDTIHSMQVLASGPMVEPKEGNLYATTVYELDQGNFVFNAGTCWWNMLLSSPPGKAGTLNPRGMFTGHPIDFSGTDPRLQTITRNLLERIRK